METLGKEGPKSRELTIERQHEYSSSPGAFFHYSGLGFRVKETTFLGFPKMIYLYRSLKQVGYLGLR